MRRGWLFAMLATCTASGQYEVARKASEYPVHATWPQFDVGCEYLVHSIPTDNGSLHARDYLVVEVAIYPHSKPVMISTAHFMLRINGSKSALLPESPGFVASSLKYPDWEERPTLVGIAGAGNGEVVLGAPTPVGRFPGDPTAGRPIGVPSKEPENTDAAGQPKQSVPLAEQVARASLPEGDARTPRKGCLYFAFKGKPKSIRTLELMYDDGHGDRGSLAITGPHANP